MSKKFWNWVKNEETNETELIFNGPISEESWFGDEITPALFRDELAKISGNLTVWLNSPGGDCLAASQIYTMLRNHKGKVTVKIDGIAASAASVVAMAGDETFSQFAKVRICVTSTRLHIKFYSAIKFIISFLYRSTLQRADIWR